jgi:hypothetical protein
MTAASQTECEVLDQIVLWSDVLEGDLVLLDDELVLAEYVNIYQDTWDQQTGKTFPRVDIWHRLGNGVLVASERHGDRYTAVKRHVTGEG